MSYNQNSKDDFWSIDKILPKRPISSYSATGKSTDCVPIEFGSQGTNGKSLPTYEQTKPTHAEAYTYNPENYLLQSVTIHPRVSPTRFYADFLNDAEKYATRHGSECKCVPFPSYVPEYRMMKKAQLDFYFYFRDCVNEGKKLEAPLSYILLYLYEIINLPHMILPESGIDKMCGIWRMYRSDYPKLDSYIADWLCDYCLIHKLSLPEAVLPYAKLLSRLSNLPEFYLDPKYTDRYTFITHSAGYIPDPDNKYPETHKLLQLHLTKALDCIAKKRELELFEPQRSFPLTTGSRNSYRSALCTYKCNALITYTVRSFSKSAILREKLADLVKYCENKVRAHLNIRARLKCPSVGELEQTILDDYFDKNLPVIRKKYVRAPQTEEQNPEFAHFYEPESVGISPEAAYSIEEKSWETAFKLEEAFSDGDKLDTASESGPVHDNKPEQAESTQADGLGGTELEFLLLVYNKNYTELKAFLKQHGLIADAVAEKINTFAFDMLGDSLLESDGENYTVIPDYTEEVEQWLHN